MAEYQFGSILDRNFRTQLQKMADEVSVHSKTIQDLVAEGQLTEEQYADLISVVNGNLKSGEVDLSDLADTLQGTINDKAQKDYVDQQLQNVASGSPKGAYVTLTDLQNAHPNGADGIYVVTEDGNWYYYDGAAWQAGGVYQSTQWQNALTTQNQDWVI